MPNDGVRNGITIIDSTGRLEQWKHAWLAYRGNLPDALKVEPGQTNDNVKVNRMASIVDKGVAFLFGNVVKFSVPPDAPDDAQDYLDACWGHDDTKMTLLGKLATNGGVTGQAFAKIIPPDSDHGRPHCRLVALDTLNMAVVTDPEDCDVVLQFVIEYDFPDPREPSKMTRKQQVITRIDPSGQAVPSGGTSLDDTWQIVNQILIGGTWHIIDEPQEWPYSFPPVAECQNLPNPNEFWGSPDIPQELIELNKVLNFVESNVSRIIKSHAHPILWTNNVNSNQTSLKYQPGRILILPGSGTLNALSAPGDIASSMTFAGELRVNMDEQSRVPAVALGRLESLPRGAISGVALQLLFQPLMEKTTQKQRQYGEMIRNLCRWMLYLGGYDALTWDIQLHWQSLLPSDDLQAAQVAMLYKQLNISDSTILSGLGLDPDAELEKVQGEQAQQLTNYAQGQGLPPTPMAITDGTQGQGGQQ